MKARRQALEAHVSDGHSARVLAELDWFWSEYAGSQSYDERVLPDFVAMLARAVRASPLVRAHFTALRDAFVPGFEVPQPGLTDWLALNDALGETEKTLQWFDAAVAARAVPVPSMTRVRRAVLERGRPSDLLHLMESPPAEVEFEINLFAEVPVPAPFADDRREEVRVETALVFQACVAAGHPETEVVRAAILAFEDSERMRALLAMPFEELARLDSTWSFTVE